MFLKNRNIIFEMKISKVTDYAALTLLRQMDFSIKLIQFSQDDPLYIYIEGSQVKISKYITFLPLKIDLCRH